MKKKEDVSMGILVKGEQRMTQQEMNYEYDSLIGNINRMCVTDDLSEMIDMYEYAQERIDKIYQYNKDRLLGKENKQ